jgi:hypothetical protein
MTAIRDGHGLQYQELEELQEPNYPFALRDWMRELRVLHRVPFQYLVPLEKMIEAGRRPDPSRDMLPLESIRFFFLDPEWVDHLVQGALSASAVGTREQDPLAKMMAATRRRLDDQAPTTGFVTGFLLRSVAVRRWPRMEVRFLDGGKALTKLRQQRLSESVMIYMAEGRPDKVEIEEPDEGTQFGVEEVAGSGYQTELRKPEGDFFTPAKYAHVGLRPSTRRVVRVDRLQSEVRRELGLVNGNVGSARIAMALQQTPYIQSFEHQPNATLPLHDLPARLNNAVTTFRGFAGGGS